MAEAAWGKLNLAENLLRVSKYSDYAIQQQLREHWLAGYVTALRDVKHERERMEEASYEAAMPLLSRQDAREISHAFSANGTW